MKKAIPTILFLLSGLVVPVIGINPILPINEFIPDPEARVWDDGRIYLYGSNDSGYYWCSTLYKAFSSSDLITWTAHGESFHSNGPDDQVPWTDARLYAPDAMFYNDTYYLYFCLSEGPDDEGVATSSSPTGPFTDGKIIEGMSGIDPAVFIDDDGQGYIYWGQSNAKAAKLKSNMIEIDQATIQSDVLTTSKHYFHEGTSMRKRGDIYYAIFADESRNSKPSCLGYATANTPFGPFTYRGVIIDNEGCDPSTWNNHGTIEEFNGQWYVFYHRSSRNSQHFRRTCVEPINFNADGTIDEVEMTSQGAEGPLNAFSQIEAEYFCKLSGTLHTEVCQEGGENLRSIKNGNYAVYKYIDFGTGAMEFSARVASNNTEGGAIEIRLDSLVGTLVGTCDVDNTQGLQNWETKTTTVAPAEGVHALYLTFTGNNEDLFNLNWFSFTPSTSIGKITDYCHTIVLDESFGIYYARQSKNILFKSSMETILTVSLFTLQGRRIIDKTGMGTCGFSAHTIPSGVFIYYATMSKDGLLQKKSGKIIIP